MAQGPFLPREALGDVSLDPVEFVDAALGPPRRAASLSCHPNPLDPASPDLCVTNFYDPMDAAYCSSELCVHSRSLGHVPLIAHNPRRGEKIELAPAEAIRYNERTAAERSNGRFKDEFGGNTSMVKGDAKVMGHLMFGVLALTADQLMRLRQ